MQERRKVPRIEVDEPAFISGDGSSTRCRVVNISPEGAAIDVPNPAYVSARFNLMLESDRSIRECKLVWIMKTRIGVVFVV
jgi:PilZ domain